jgi:putative Holliday junction resolvase
MRILAVDYGRARLGLAMSDEDGVLASPLPSLPRSRRDLDEIARLARSRSAARIVVGLPLSMDGSNGAMAAEARAFAQQLAQSACLPVDLFDERWTSAEAERAMIEGDLSRRRRKELRDGLAAVLILQAYLDQRAASRGARPLDEDA